MYLVAIVANVKFLVSHDNVFFVINTILHVTHNAWKRKGSGEGGQYHTMCVQLTPHWQVICTQRKIKMKDKRDKQILKYEKYTNVKLAIQYIVIFVYPKNKLK